MRRRMPPPPTRPLNQWLLQSATIILSMVSHGTAFRINSSISSPFRISTPSWNAIVLIKMSAPSSFRQERLGEQIRLLAKKKQDEKTSDATDIINGYREDLIERVAADAAGNATASLTQGASDILALENDAALFIDGLPDAPMMTYQKYLTMQEKRVKVTIRYSAEAGLRPFYLTVAEQIKSTHPDVLLEKRILPHAGGEEAVFEVVIDGKTVIGKKKTKMLKVSSRSPAKGSRGEERKVENDEVEARMVNAGGGEANAPDIAGGRSIFVSMEKLDHELSKARKRRRPNSMYKSREDVLRGAMVTASKGNGVHLAGSQQDSIGEKSSLAPSTGMTEAVMRLEKLKAMSARKKE